MRILITGGAGFIGSHLADYLHKQGHNVYVLDNFSSGKRENLVNFPPGTASFPKIFDCDLRNWAKFRHAVSESRPQFIYHLAATVGVNRVLKDPKGCINNNIEGVRTVLASGIPGIFASTSEVYGKNDSILREDSSLIYSSKERWSYAASKLIGEWLALDGGWKIVRFFNIVGPRQSSDYGAVLPKFTQQALDNQKLTVYGDGSQIRTFMDVRDCVEVLDKLREKKFNIVNVGGKNIINIQDLAVLVVNTILGQYGGILLSAQARITNIPYAEAHPDNFEECPSRIPDLSNLDELVPERQHTELKQTILDLASHIKEGKEVTV